MITYHRGFQMFAHLCLLSKDDFQRLFAINVVKIQINLTTLFENYSKYRI